MFVHVKQHTPKLQDKALEGRLAGYCTDSKGVRVYNSKTHREIESSDVTFIEPPPHKITPTETEPMGNDDNGDKKIFC